MPDPIVSPEFLRFLASLGVGGVIAGLMFMIYRKDMSEYMRRWEGQSDALLTALTNSTKAVALNTEVIRALSDRIDRMDK